jgi:hypothetical protein
MLSVLLKVRRQSHYQIEGADGAADGSGRSEYQIGIIDVCTNHDNAKAKGLGEMRVKIKSKADTRRYPTGRYQVFRVTSEK